MSASALDHHLATCLDCARWAESAAQVTRLARLGVAEVPDLAEHIVQSAALPARRVLRRRMLLRLLLLVVALIQLAIAIPALTGDSIGMAMSAHAAHEAAAWNLAIGAAFLAAVVTPRRAAGLIPLLATFIVVLGVLSVRDLADGAVTYGRVSTHLAAVAGLLLLFAIDRAERALPPGRHGSGSSERHGDGDGHQLRGVA
jgi:predicted anti-sigma-YlaC factor YlaD